MRGSLVAVVGIGAVCAAVALAVLPGLMQSELDSLVGRGVPYQYYEELSGDLMDDYGDVIVVAHNSGNAIHTAEEAIAYGADAVEIDVRSSGGRLYASHDSPWPIIGSVAYPRPSLEAAFDAAQSKIVMLDLKGPSSGYGNRLARFLEMRREDHRHVIAVSENPRILDDLRRDAPWVARFVSVGSTAQLSKFEGDEAFVRLAGGVSVKHTLLDEETVTRLKRNGLLVYAWTVNSMDRVNELVRMGVDGIMTDNLAIMEVLGDKGEGFEPAPEGGLT